MDIKVKTNLISKLQKKLQMRENLNKISNILLSNSDEQK